MNGLASYIKQAEESTDYQVGDAFDIEFGETQLIETTIVEILEDGIVIQMDSVGLDLMIENNLRLEEKSLSDYDADQEEHFGEGGRHVGAEGLPRRRLGRARLAPGEAGAGAGRRDRLGVAVASLSVQRGARAAVVVDAVPAVPVVPERESGVHVERR